MTTVLAASETAAIKTAIKENSIEDPEQQRRQVAWPEGWCLGLEN